MKTRYICACVCAAIISVLAAGSAHHGRTDSSRDKKTQEISKGGKIQMINGDPKEFIDGLYYGDERFFLFNEKKYLIQGYCENGKHILEAYIFEPPENDFEWCAFSDDNNYPVAEFESAAIFDNKTFWEVENGIEWIDY